MPKLGKKHYPYTKKGKTAARKAAKRTGKPMHLRCNGRANDMLSGGVGHR